MSSCLEARILVQTHSAVFENFTIVIGTLIMTIGHHLIVLLHLEGGVGQLGRH